MGIPTGLVNDLQQTLGQGAERLFDLVPVQLRAVLIKKLWQKCTDARGVPFTTFEAFVTHRLPQGLESTIDDLLFFCRAERYADVRELIRAECSVNHCDVAAGRH